MSNYKTIKFIGMVLMLVVSMPNNGKAWYITNDPQAVGSTVEGTASTADTTTRVTKSTVTLKEQLQSIGDSISTQKMKIMDEIEKQKKAIEESEKYQKAMERMKKLKEKAEKAKEKAEKVKEKAEKAKEKAEKGINKAKEYQEKAQEYQQKAADIKGKVDEVQTKAKELQSQADEYKSMTTDAVDGAKGRLGVGSNGGGYNQNYGDDEDYGDEEVYTINEEALDQYGQIADYSEFERDAWDGELAQVEESAAPESKAPVSVRQPFSKIKDVMRQFERGASGNMVVQEEKINVLGNVAPEAEEGGKLESTKAPLMMKNAVSEVEKARMLKATEGNAAMKNTVQSETKARKPFSQINEQAKQGRKPFSEVNEQAKQGRKPFSQIKKDVELKTIKTEAVEFKKAVTAEPAVAKEMSTVTTETVAKTAAENNGIKPTGRKKFNRQINNKALTPTVLEPSAEEQPAVMMKNMMQNKTDLKTQPVQMKSLETKNVLKTSEIKVYDAFSKPMSFAQEASSGGEGSDNGGVKTGSNEYGDFIFSDMIAEKCDLNYSDVDIDKVKACIAIWVKGLKSSNAQDRLGWTQDYKKAYLDHTLNDYAEALNDKAYAASFGQDVSKKLDEKSSLAQDQRGDSAYSASIAQANQEVIIRLMRSMTAHNITQAWDGLPRLDAEYLPDEENGGEDSNAGTNGAGSSSGGQSSSTNNGGSTDNGQSSANVGGNTQTEQTAPEPETQPSDTSTSSNQTGNNSYQGCGGEGLPPCDKDIDSGGISPLSIREWTDNNGTKHRITETRNDSEEEIYNPETKKWEIIRKDYSSKDASVKVWTENGKRYRETIVKGKKHLYVYTDGKWVEQK